MNEDIYLTLIQLSSVSSKKRQKIKINAHFGDQFRIRKMSCPAACHLVFSGRVLRMSQGILLSSLSLMDCIAGMFSVRILPRILSFLSFIHSISHELFSERFRLCCESEVYNWLWVSVCQCFCKISNTGKTVLRIFGESFEHNVFDFLWDARVVLS